jgi:hypothetical protein
MTNTEATADTKTDADAGPGARIAPEKGASNKACQPEEGRAPGQSGGEESRPEEKAGHQERGEAH